MQKLMEESTKIKVYLNGKETRIFKGMKVKHVLSAEMVKAVRNGSKLIVDREGNEWGLEGSLSEGEEIFVKNRKNPLTFFK